MYCDCDNRQPIKQTVLHQTYLVCSKRLGGCGKEILDEPPEVPKDDNDDLHF